MKIQVGEEYFIGEIKNSVFYPYCMPNGEGENSLWQVKNTGEVKSSSFKYAGGFKDWLDNKVKDIYPITGGQPEVIELKVGEIIDLSLYTTIE